MSQKRPRRMFRDGRVVVAHQDVEARRAWRRAKKKLEAEEKAASRRAKYGPGGKPALVVVRTLGGEAVEVVDQAKLGAHERANNLRE